MSNGAGHRPHQAELYAGIPRGGRHLYRCRQSTAGCAGYSGDLSTGRETERSPDARARGERDDQNRRETFRYKKI
jgi:hypothetical protein